MHLYIENLNRELRDLASHRQRFDRPEYPSRGRMRKLIRALAHSPAHAVGQPGQRVPKVTFGPHERPTSVT